MAGKILVLLATAILCVYAVKKDNFHYLDHEFDRTELGDSVDRATVLLLKEAYESADDKNVVASPLGVFILLSLYKAGAGPESKLEIVRLLAASNSKLFDSYAALGSRLATLDPNFFTLANKLYYSDNYTVQPSFASWVTRSQGELEKINFTNSKAAVDAMNKWGEEKTRGHIKKPVPDDVITPETKLALLNVIFFQGQWNVPFKAQYTKDEDFHLDRTTTVKKPMMRLQQPLFYYESNDIGAKLIELPYQQKGFRMVVVIPNELDGLSSVLDKIHKTGILGDVFKLSPAYAEIDFHMPKFEIKSEFNLKILLPKIGIGKIFEEAADDILQDVGVVVSEAFQKAFVKVDEEGSTAGAFTGLVVVGVSSFSKPPPPIEVKADHPFLFLILHEDKIIFSGTYTH